jgi:hypothetical protein
MYFREYCQTFPSVIPISSVSKHAYKHVGPQWLWLALFKGPNRIWFFPFFLFTWGRRQIQPPKRRVFCLLKIRTMDKVQKPISLIQQPSSEPFRIYIRSHYSLYEVCQYIISNTKTIYCRNWRRFRANVSFFASEIWRKLRRNSLHSVVISGGVGRRRSYTPHLSGGTVWQRTSDMHGA